MQSFQQKDLINWGDFATTARDQDFAYNFFFDDKNALPRTPRHFLEEEFPRLPSMVKKELGTGWLLGKK